MTLYYVGLEPYNDRYTLQLQDWNERSFERRGIDYKIVEGDKIDNSMTIKVGQVLDAHGRSFYALSQMQKLVQLLRDGEIQDDDVIYFEDMFHPGITALPYIFYQSKDRPRVFVRCLAQSVDPDDFVHVTNMQNWMHHYEMILDEFVDGILASNEEMVAHMKIAGWKNKKIYNISGLAFDADEVRSRVDTIPNWFTREKTVVFASRWDQEKQPDIFMDLAEAEEMKDIKFVLAQGSSLRSNRQKYVDRARALSASGKLTIKENLSKNEYYKLLANSKVLFNCALQDWTSNTVSEADALGCNVVFPAYRSFPEILNNDETRMYTPWSKKDMMDKITRYTNVLQKDVGKISRWTSGTVDRILDIIGGDGEEWLRSDKNYRNYVSSYKY